ncbi:MAG: TldD/PmbA family protein, partial [Candidatus Cloacimonadota bacterium]|nr:TldD/PmbA family protein [Candidatus Cloacimonadota bacterium]
MLEKQLVSKVLDAALVTGADFAEIFVEDTKNSSIQFSDNKTKQSITGKDYGAGIRVIFGTSAIYGYTNDTSEEALLETAKTVATAGKINQKKKVFDLTKKEIINNHLIEVDNFDVALNEKIEFIKKINKYARAEGERISQVSIRMAEKNQKVLIANSDGLWVTDERNYSRISSSAIATDGTSMQTGGENPGSFAGYEFFRSLNPEKIGRSISKMALTMLDAKYAPSGKFPVIIDNAFGGVIFHEACGHSLETTSVAKGASVFSDKLGEKIANSVVTAIDDGTMKNEWGSIN